MNIFSKIIDAAFSVFEENEIEEEDRPLFNKIKNNKFARIGLGIYLFIFLPWVFYVIFIR